MPPLPLLRSEVLRSGLLRKGLCGSVCGPLPGSLCSPDLLREGRLLRAALPPALPPLPLLLRSEVLCSGLLRKGLLRSGLLRPLRLQQVIRDSKE